MAEQTKIIRPQAGFQEKFVRTNVDFSVSGGVLNCGKAQPYNSLICTPNGFVRMGDLKIGDVISDTNGGIQKVEDIFERGVLECCKVSFDDGSIVECCPEHLWTVWDKLNKKYETIELQQIEMCPSRYCVDLVSPVMFNYSGDKTIHPYLLGALLGDAYLGSEKCGSSIKIDTNREIVDRAHSLKSFNFLWRKYGKKNGFAIFNDKEIRNELKRLGLFEKRSHQKFIPKEYLYTTIEERIELLRGLFDTDGYNDNRSYRVEYCTVSEQLAKDVSFLVRSLGGKVSIYTKIGSYKNKENVRVQCKKVYRISCRLKDKNNFFSLKRKIKSRKQGKEIRLNFMSIARVEDKKMRCIRVSNPNHLYITDNFVMTHNTFAAALSVAEPSKDGRFRGVFLRNNLGDIRAAGSIIDTFKEIYGSAIDVVESGEPRVTFKESGARIDITHVADQSREKVLQRFKGRQYDFIYFDEGTGFTWECFSAIYTRNRGTASWSGKVRMTTNPDRNHWLRKFLDWYIGADGFIMPEREGVVRYFFMNGETVNDVVWGDTKKEVYQKCKVTIDRTLAKINGSTGTATYEDLIKSFTFYLGKMSENKASIGNNKGYAGSVAIMGGRNAQQLLEGNWNVSPSEDENAPIPSDIANEVFMNDPQRNGDKWVTCDLADTGTDNFLAIAWNGFHIEDILILGQTTPRMNAERLQMFAADHNIADSHIIYDAIRGTYINDYIPDAIPFVSYRQPIGLYGRAAYNLKAECYLRLVEAIKRGYLSFDDRIANKIYEHQKLKENITIQAEFMEECSVVRFKDMPSGKKALMSKKEMNAKLGKDRSMDLLDPCAMRFFACLEYPYGEELERTAGFMEDEDDDKKGDTNIYDEGFWA